MKPAFPGLEGGGFGASDFLTASYTRFVLHHAPAALLRRSTRGFLLRVETWVEDGEMAAAEARCADFLAKILAAAQERLKDN